MRAFPVFLVLAMLAGGAAAATTPRLAPLEFSAAHSQRMSALSPSLRQWVRQEAKDVDTASLDVEVVKTSAQQRLAGQDFTDADLEALALLVLQQVAKDADEDLHAVAEDMRSQQEKRRAMREAQRANRDAQAGAKEAAQPEAKDSLSETSEEVSMKMQLIQDRRAKAIETMSNIMKKSSDTAATISANLK